MTRAAPASRRASISLRTSTSWSGSQTPNGSAPTCSSANGRHQVWREAATTTTSGSSRRSSEAVAATSSKSRGSKPTCRGPPASSATIAVCPARARPSSARRPAPTSRSTSGSRARASKTRVPRSPRPITSTVAPTAPPYHARVSDAVAAGRRTTRSGELYERALDVLVDGVASPSRGTLNYRPYPLFMARGEGGEIVDVDGNRYVDLMLAYGALPHGHAHPRLVRAAQEAVEQSALLATATEIEIEVAERLIEMIPSAERIRFANTGIEAWWRRSSPSR